MGWSNARPEDIVDSLGRICRSQDVVLEQYSHVLH